MYRLVQRSGETRWTLEFKDDGAAEFEFVHFWSNKSEALADLAEAGVTLDA